MDRKREFENKFSNIQQNDASPALPKFAKESESKRDSRIISASNVLSPFDKRSMLEILVHPRFREFKPRIYDNIQSSSLQEISGKEEKMRRLWLPIARRTFQCANRGDGSDKDINNEKGQTDDFIILNDHVEVPEESLKKVKLFFAHAVEYWNVEFYL
ncbi:hypothetical protein ACH5RR_015451 [Cinchona calisaya]|uniref:Uncharacterized protein n=1 Tax=Cinchona calisaya TaxID=153742 RepID=A0ABD2ZWS2_9GENT